MNHPLPAGLRRLMLAAPLLLLAGCGDSGLSDPAGGTGGGAGAPTVKVLSNRADLISGGDALVEVVPVAGSGAQALKVLLNGRDVTPQFALRDNGRIMAQLTGLVVGDNQLRATLGGASTTVAILNHPNGGPIFGGPQPNPWRCSNAATALNAQCDQPAT